MFFEHRYMVRILTELSNFVFLWSTLSVEVSCLYIFYVSKNRTTVSTFLLTFLRFLSVFTDYLHVWCRIHRNSRYMSNLFFRKVSKELLRSGTIQCEPVYWEGSSIGNSRSTKPPIRYVGECWPILGNC